MFKNFSLHYKLQFIIKFLYYKHSIFEAVN